MSDIVSKLQNIRVSTDLIKGLIDDKLEEIDELYKEVAELKKLRVTLLEEVPDEYTL